MKHAIIKHTSPIAALVLLVGCDTGSSGSAPEVEIARAEATGFVEVDGKRIELGHPVVEAVRGGWSLSLTDAPLPPGCVGTAASFALFEQNQPFTGLDIDIDVSEQGATANASWLVHPTLEPIAGRFMEMTEHPVEVKDGMLVGRLEETVELAGQTWKMGVDFSMPAAGQYRSPSSFAGERHDLADTVQQMVHAVFAGNLDEVERLSAGEFANRINSSEQPRAEIARDLVVFADFLFPERITVDSVSVNGDNAVLKASGESTQCPGTPERSTGTINLVREAGAWKVSNMSWEQVES